MKNLKSFVILVFSLFLLSGFKATPYQGVKFEPKNEEYDIDDVTFDFYFGITNPENHRVTQYYVGD